MTLEGAVAGLLDELERISREHEEVTDTDVREAIHLALNWYFVWGREGAQFPRNFRMFSARGNRLVSGAIARFLEAVKGAGEEAHVPAGHARLCILQGPSAKTSEGRLYDEFIGHRETALPPEPLPEDMFSDGERDQPTDGLQAMPGIRAQRGKFARMLMVGLAVAEAAYASVALREWLLVRRILNGGAPERRFASDAMVGEGGVLYSSPSLYAWFHLGAACVALLIAAGSAWLLLRKESRGGVWLVAALVAQVLAEALVGQMGR